MLTLIQILQVLIDLARWLIVIQIILSLLLAFNVINRYNEFVRTIDDALTRLTEPVYRPIRRILPDFGSIDFSPAVVLLLLSLIDIVLTNLAGNIVAGTPL